MVDSFFDKIVPGSVSKSSRILILERPQYLGRKQLEQLNYLSRLTDDLSSAKDSTCRFSHNLGSNLRSRLWGSPKDFPNDLQDCFLLEISKELNLFHFTLPAPHGGNSRGIQHLAALCLGID